MDFLRLGLGSGIFTSLNDLVSVFSDFSSMNSAAFSPSLTEDLSLESGFVTVWVSFFFVLSVVLVWDGSVRFSELAVFDEVELVSLSTVLDIVWFSGLVLKK